MWLELILMVFSLTITHMLVTDEEAIFVDCELIMVDTVCIYYNLDEVNCTTVIYYLLVTPYALHLTKNITYNYFDSR